MRTNRRKSSPTPASADPTEWHVAYEPGTPEEEFERLRQRFHQRLRKEQAQLSALADSMGSVNIASASILTDLGLFAHRLRGAALVFGFQELGDDAKAVELAAIAASLDLSGQSFGQSVATTMGALANNLVKEIGTGAPCAPALQCPTAPAGKSS